MSLSFRPRSRPDHRASGPSAHGPLSRAVALVVTLLAATFVAFGPAQPASAAPPSLTATPNPVVIPVGQNGGSYKYTWNTGSTAKAYITVAIGSGTPTVVVANGASAGSQIGLITYGTTQTMRLYADKTSTRPLATVQVTTRRPDQSCAGTCIKSVRIDPHGTFAGFEVIATSKLKSFELTAFLDNQPVAGMIGVDTANWNTFLLHLRPGTAYDYALEVKDEAGNSQKLSGNFTTQKRLVTVTFGDLKITDDSDDLSDGDLTIWYNADTWMSAVDDKTIGTGDTWFAGRQFQIIGAPDLMTIGMDIADDDCGGLSLCSEGLGTIRSSTLSGDGHKCFTSSEQDAAGVWKSVLTLQSGFGEEFSDDIVLNTTSCALKYRAEVHFDVTYI